MCWRATGKRCHSSASTCGQATLPHPPHCKRHHHQSQHPASDCHPQKISYLISLEISIIRFEENSVRFCCGNKLNKKPLILITFECDIARVSSRFPWTVQYHFAMSIVCSDACRKILRIPAIIQLYLIIHTIFVFFYRECHEKENHIRKIDFSCARVKSKSLTSFAESKLRICLTVAFASSCFSCGRRGCSNAKHCDELWQVWWLEQTSVELSFRIEKCLNSVCRLDVRYRCVRWSHLMRWNRFWATKLEWHRCHSTETNSKLRDFGIPSSIFLPSILSFRSSFRFFPYKSS